jgi:hypothetical protein
MDIRIRASKRAGQLMAKGKKAKAIAGKGKPRNNNIVANDIIPARKLKDLGIRPDQESGRQAGLVIACIS